jgi:hypothetical protein
MRSTTKSRSVAAHLAYLRYLARHKWYVLLACKSVGASTWAGLVHDLSKFLPSEWLPYLRTFYDQNGRKQYEPGPDFPWRGSCTSDAIPTIGRHGSSATTMDP